MALITQQEFTANLEQMPEEAQIQVVQLIEENEPPILQAFAMSLGVNLSMGEEPMGEEPMGEEQPSVLDEVMTEQPVALEEPVPVEAPLPEASPMQNQMQQLALGDQVAGMIEQPGAEDQTGVADDVPMNAREGAFIVNAAAIAKVGKKDFEERIIEPAIKYLKETEGIDINKATITRPAQQVKGNQKILASNKEYHIPPELAEVIGTDLLEKINKRGEAETEKKLTEQEQQPQQQQQQDFAQKQVPVRASNGGEIRPKKKPKAPPLNNERRIDMLARLLVSESEGEGREGMQAVANVVQNRIKDSSPDTGFRNQKTFESVITAKNQFTGYANDRYYEAQSKGAAWKRALDVAKQAVEGKLQDITQGSTYYRNKNIPVGTKGSSKEGQGFFDKNLATGNFETYKNIGKHTFYKEKRSSTYSPRPKRKPAPPAQQTQNSFMGKAPPIGSLEDDIENQTAKEQVDKALALRGKIMQPPVN